MGDVLVPDGADTIVEPDFKKLKQLEDSLEAARSVSKSTRQVEFTVAELLSLTENVLSGLTISDENRESLSNATENVQLASQNCTTLAQALSAPEATLDADRRKEIHHAAGALLAAISNLEEGYQFTILPNDLQNSGLLATANNVSVAAEKLVEITEAATDTDFLETVNLIAVNSETIIAEEGNVTVRTQSKLAIESALPLLLSGAENVSENWDDESRKQRLNEYTTKVSEIVNNISVPDDSALSSRAKSLAENLQQIRLLINQNEPLINQTDAIVNQIEPEWQAIRAPPQIFLPNANAATPTYVGSAKATTLNFAAPALRLESISFEKTTQAVQLKKVAVSKGIHCYSYLDQTLVSSKISVKFTVPGKGNTLDCKSAGFGNGNLQLSSAHLPWYNKLGGGPFTWAALHGETELAKMKNEISAFFGNLLKGSEMDVMLKTPPKIFASTNTMISYGFYDAGNGSNGLTNQNQSYVHCTRILTTWMGDLVKQFEKAATQPFYNFVLAGAHDAGMNTLDTVNSILAGNNHTEAFKKALGKIGGAVIALPAGDIATICLNAAMTQKDSTKDMLDLGCRYFDFRPGTMVKKALGFNGVRFHQHAVVPGVAYVQFLQDVLAWLKDHPTEIVVVSCNTQGFLKDKMKPTVQELESDLAAARQKSGVTSEIVAAGDKRNLENTYTDLISTKTRLIFLNQIAQERETTKYDSYSGKLYGTKDPHQIVQALSEMNTKGQEGHTYTVLQLQGTVSSIIQPISFVTKSKTASPLMSTKPKFDSVTHPWLIENAIKNLKAPKPIILLNDFVDNVTADTAITLTKQRMGL